MTGYPAELDSWASLLRNGTLTDDEHADLSTFLTRVANWIVAGCPDEVPTR